MSEQKKAIKQVEKLEKVNDNEFKLTVENYGGHSNQTLIQIYNKEQLRGEYDKLKQQHHMNMEEVNNLKKAVMSMSDDEEKELQAFADMLNKMKQFNNHMQAKARIDMILEQQEAIRRGMKQIETGMPEVTRKK